MDANQIAERIINKYGSYEVVLSYAIGMIQPLYDRAEAAEVRASQAESCSDTYAETVETLVVEKAQAEAERDKFANAFNLECGKVVDLRRQLSEAQTAIDAMAQIVGAADEVKHQLEQARSDIEDYRARINELRGELKQSHQREESLCDEIEKSNEIIRGYADRLSEATA